MVALLTIPFLIAAAAGAGETDSLLARGNATACDVDLYGRIILVDAPQGTLTLFSTSGAMERTSGGSGWGNDQLDLPAAVWMKNGIDVFVADTYNHRIQRFDRNLNFVSSLFTRESPDPDERFGYPSDVALSRTGDLYICDTENARVLKFTASSRIDRSFGRLAAGQGRLHRPAQLEIGPGDRLYVLDGSCVLVFDPFGNFLRTLGETMNADSVALSADQEGLALLEGDSVAFFDGDDRPAATLHLAGLVGPGLLPAAGLTVRGDDLYLLLRGGVAVLRGVRKAALTK